MARISMPSTGPGVVFGDDDVLHHVHETAGQVTGVRRLEGGVRETLTGAVRGGKVLEHRQAFTETRGDRGFDDFAGGLGHQAAHTGELTHLGRRCLGHPSWTS